MMGRLAVGERQLAEIKWYRCGLIATSVRAIVLEDTVQSFCIVAAIAIMDGILTIQSAAQIVAYLLAKTHCFRVKISKSLSVVRRDDGSIELIDQLIHLSQ